MGIFLLIHMGNPLDSLEDEDEYGDDDDNDNHTSIHNIVRQMPPANTLQPPSTNGMAVSAGPTPAEIIGDVEQNKDQGEQADPHISKKCLCSWDLGALGALGSLIKKLHAPRAELGVFGSNWSMGSAESET